MYLFFCSEIRLCKVEVDSMKQLSLLDEADKKIDKKATIKNTREFLDREVDKLRLMAAVCMYPSSPKIDGQPSGSGFNPLTPSAGDRYSEARKDLTIIKAAINACGGVYSKILTGLYFDDQSNNQIIMEIGYAPVTYYQSLKPKAFLRFAEAYSGVKDLRLFVNNEDITHS